VAGASRRVFDGERYRETAPKRPVTSSKLQMTELPRLLIATNNPGKVDEFRALLAGCGWQIVAPDDLGLTLDVDETGETYLENALIKAEAFSHASGLAALADDSGLEVDALGGEPGALHHVHGWDGRNQAERIQILLDALRSVPPGARTARFRAVLVVVQPDGSVIQEEGACEGVIALSPSGSQGFGYDPVFYLPALDRTMAQLNSGAKNRVSHRALAAEKLRERLKELSQA
jgi:XTP/dITP diphosphohydrolase